MHWELNSKTQVVVDGTTTHPRNPPPPPIGTFFGHFRRVRQQPAQVAGARQGLQAEKASVLERAWTVETRLKQMNEERDRVLKSLD